MTPVRQRMLEDRQRRGLAPRTQQVQSGPQCREVLVCPHAAPLLAAARPASPAVPQQAAERAQSGRSLAYRRPRQASALSRLLEGDLCLWPAFARRRPPASLPDRQRAHAAAHALWQRQYRPRHPLAARTLTLLRAHWRLHRNPVWVFPGTAPTGEQHAKAPMDESGLQKAFRQAVQAAGVSKPATIHSLRHSWATHLLESGVNVRVLQLWMGHASPTTTTIYTHLTQHAEQRAATALEHLTAGLP
jgi:hypothetical protein